MLTGLAASIAAPIQTMAQPLPFEVVDSHVHLFDPNRIPHPWLDGVPSIRRPVRPSEYRASAGEVGIRRLIAVEAAPDPDFSLEEARWLLAQGREDPIVAAVVAQARVESGAGVERELEDLVRAGPIRGIRRIVGPPFQTDPDFALRPAVQEGVRRLARHGLVFELAGVTGANLSRAASLVRACPEVTFILNHLGRPPIREGILGSWASGIRELATSPNVSCKLSNLIRDAGPGWTVDRIRPFVDVAVDAFGFDRLLFGSDWPVVTLAESGGIAASVGLLASLLATASEADRTKVFSGNAIRLYRL